MEKTRRTSIDINQDILRLCIIPRKRTHIVYGTNINFNLAHKYISHLLEKELLKQTKRLYETTAKGENLLMSLINVEHEIELVNI